MLAIANSVAYSANFLAGWSLILAGFLSGACLGLAFHRDDFLGGYASFPRRLLRLGHIAAVALGSLNLLFALSPLPVTAITRCASLTWIAGAVAMPVVCCLTAWRPALRRLFPVPVALLVTAVVCTLIGGVSP